MCRSTFFPCSCCNDIEYLEDLDVGEEQELTAEEEVEGRGRQGAEADGRLMGRGANDELHLVD